MNKICFAFAIILGIWFSSNIKCTEKQKLAIACTFKYEPVCEVKVDPNSNQIQSFNNYGSKHELPVKKEQNFMQVENVKSIHNIQYFAILIHIYYLVVLENQILYEYFDESFQCQNSQYSSNYSYKCSVCINKKISYYVQGFCK
ncbi:hypothetical protein ABPG74_002994 [Tetrahymena malaccensis]